MSNIQTAITAIQNGEVIAYPTEAVFGLGCDPLNQQAVEKILSLKQRPVEKGLILIAANESQILPYIQETYLNEAIIQSWQSKPITWVFPASEKAPKWITGDFDSIAIRVTQHPTVKKICEKLNSAIVSTSANPSGEAPAKSCQQIRDYFGEAIFCLDEALGNLQQPTEIWHAQTGKRLR